MKDVIGYEGYYKVNENGEILSTRSGKFLKLNYKKNGYVYVELNVNGIAKTHRVHRLVAIAYIPNPESLPFVHHINNNKADNRMVNLEWTSVSENTKRAYDDGLLVISNNKREYYIRKDNVDVEMCNSYIELTELTGYRKSSIANYIRLQIPLKQGKYKGCTITSIQV